MPGFICDYLNEMVLLSDGRVTTCCLDPLGQNALADIYRADYAEVQKTYLKIRAQITHDVLSMPRCEICYSKLKAAGFPRTGTYCVNPDPDRIDFFLNQAEQASRQFVIELSSLCNLKCNGCMQSRYKLQDYRLRPYLDIERLQSWLKPKGEKIKNIRLYNYGETFMHPEAIEFCSWLKQQHPDTLIGIATNGLMLNTHAKRVALIKTGIDAMTFSIHGSDQAGIEKYMTPDFHFEKILEILKDMVAVRADLNLKKPHLTWKYLLFEWNDSEEDIERAQRLSKEIGLDGLQFCLVGYPSPSRRFTPNSSEWKKLREIDSFQIKNNS